MEDPNLIATLIPVDTRKLAENAFRLPHNRARYFAPDERSTPPSTPRRHEHQDSRETTPAPQAPCGDYVSCHRIELSLKDGLRPKNIQDGYVFGTDPACDILLRGQSGISGRHFSIAFDEQRRVILRDFSRHGTSVGYNTQAREEVRHHFTWLLSLDEEWPETIVHVPHMHGLEFKVELASHESCEAEYLENVNMFLAESRVALPPLDILGIYSHQTTAPASEPLSPRQRPIYFKSKELGRGTFGRVDKAVDVSTGFVYAGKEFFRPYLRENNTQAKELQKHNWKKDILTEVHIMRSYPHLRIVQVVDFQEEPFPFMVMPYFYFGNLEDLHRDSPIAVEETVDILFQCLEALKYLHPRGVAHRDLKPANILVESRVPFSIKLADFGLAKVAKDGSYLKTFCGTLLYCAPEIYSAETYTPSVDLWSLGVIVLEYAYGLPDEIKKRRGKHKDEVARKKEWGLSWCQRIVDQANDWDSDPLIALLTIGMLKIDPDERFPADECCKKGSDLGLFASHAFDAGSATPTQRTDPQGGIDADDGSTTIMLGPLWSTERISINEDNDRTRCGSQGKVFKLLGDDIQASVELRTTQIRRVSTTVKKRDNQTRSSSHRVTRQLKRRRITVPSVSATWAP